MKRRIKRLLSSALVIALLLSLVPAVLADEPEDPTTGQINIVHRYTGSENNPDFLNKMDVPGPDYNVAVQNESFVLPRPTTSDMTVGDKEDTSVIPYFWDDDGYKWVVTAYVYRYYPTQGSSSSQTSLGNFGTNTWTDTSLTYYAPVTVVNRGTTTTMYSTVTYTWEKTEADDQGTHTVSYDLNIAESGTEAVDGQLPAGLELCRLNNGDVFTSSTLYVATQEVDEGLYFTINPARVKTSPSVGYENCTDLFARKAITTEDGSKSYVYYELTGCKVKKANDTLGETLYKTGDSMQMGESDITLVAQWKQFDPTDVKTGPKVPFASSQNIYLETTETGGLSWVTKDAKISQKTSTGSWTSKEHLATEPLELNEDRQVSYMAELAMNQNIALMLQDQPVTRPTFAHFDIKVQLDPALVFVNQSGYITFSFSSTFLQPERTDESKTNKAVIIDTSGNTIYEGLYNTDGNSYVYTVPASVLKNNATFVLPMEWKPTEAGYSSTQLTTQMVLQVATTIIPGEEEKTVVTTGKITGSVDLSKANIPEAAIFKYLIGLDSDWKAYAYGDDGVLSGVEYVTALEHFKYAMKNITFTSNEVYAHVDGPEQPTGSLTVTKYVADNKAVEGQKYTFTATINDQEEPFTLKAGETWTKSGIALDTTYSIKETNSNGYNTTYYNEAGIITEENPDAAAVVINVPKNEGALVISKTVNGGSLTKEFTFTVELSAEGEYRYTGSKTGTIASGETVTLKNGESISINNLPEGTTYTVTETAEDDYTTTVSGHDATDPCYGNTASGTIVAGAAAVVHYTNTYQYTPVIPDPPVGPTTPTTPVEPSKPELNLEDHVAYIIGYVDGTVRPLNDISRSEAATIFFRLLTDESRAYYWSQTNPYSDVDAGDWFNNAISTLSNAGIITGYPDGTFRPDAPITRSEFAAIAARFSEVVWNGGNSFSDVPENHWAARYIALAEHLGWITGYPDGTFKPEQNITRAESMTLINRVLERAVEEEHMLPDMVTWVDNVPGTWYYEAVQEATNSHEYVRLAELVPGQDFCYEDWQEILAVPDWAALERTWSTANSK